MAKPTAVLPLGLPFPAEFVPGDECHALAPRLLWLAIIFPQLAVEAVAEGCVGEPLAVMEEMNGRQFIHAVTPAAQQHGVAPGMAVSSAYALCPQLRVMRRNPQAEQRCLAVLAQWAGQFTSWVSVQPPQALLLEIGGSLRLFGGMKSLHRRVENELRNGPHRFTSAIAPTPQAALLLSVQGNAMVITQAEALRSVLGGYPVNSLPLDQRTLVRLDKTGLRSLRDLWRLPRDDLARRFGAELIDYLDRLLGRRSEPRQAYVMPHRYAADIDLPLEVNNTALILNAVEQLLQGLCDFLRARDAGVNRLQLWLYHAQHPATRLTIGARRSSRHSGDWRRLIDERLNHTRLAAPVISVRLAADELHAFTPGRRTLFNCSEGDGMDEDWHMLLDQLQARLGAEAVRGLQAIADHRPEYAWRYGQPGMPQPLCVLSAKRPLWLLRQPRPLSRLGNFHLHPGVERIEGGWWDGADNRRDYYRASDRQGRCLWLFRDLRGDGRWYLHGLYG